MLLLKHKNVPEVHRCEIRLSYFFDLLDPTRFV